ncbi:MAG: hypothetical protein KDD56_08040, partial [Bdellovibrionales bacterium]|nr:hypothetical protein [Bdellovibrionales bacterium]
MQNTGSESNQLEKKTPINKQSKKLKTLNIDIDIDDKSALNSFTIVKRNGMIVPFRRSRIQAAIEAAFRETFSVPTSDPLPVEQHKAVKQVTDEVVKEAISQAGEDASLTVEAIQDIVEDKLLEGEHHDVGRKYIVYREERKILREDSPRN